MDNANRSGYSPLSQKAIYERRVSSARIDLILVAMLSIINVIFLFTEKQTYFLFSAFIPYRTAFFGALLTGRMPEEYYAEWGDASFFGNGFMVAMLTAAAIVIALYIMCFFLSKNKIGWLVFATVLFVLDTLAFLGYAFTYGVMSDSVIDVIIHAYMIYALVSGIVSFKRLKALPEEVESSEALPDTSDTKEDTSEDDAFDSNEQ